MSDQQRIISALERIACATENTNRFEKHFDELKRGQRVIENKLSAMETKIMASLQEALDAITDEETVEDSIVVLLTDIKAKLDAALAGGLTPENQAKVDAIFQKSVDAKAKLAAAIVANTPSA